MGKHEQRSKRRGRDADEGTSAHLKSMHNVMAWDKHCPKSVFSWAGHLARMATYAAEREASKVFSYKNWDWIKRIADINQGSQLHCRRLRTWRWERPMAKFFDDVLPGSSGQVHAQDKTSWTSQLESMAEWRCRAR